MLFRPEKFCMPMTIKGALIDDQLAMNRGYVQLLPETDTAGRAIIYIDWSRHEPSLGYTEESMVRLEDFNRPFIFPCCRHVSFSHPLLQYLSKECFGTWFMLPLKM
jgi:hypothetical protein